MKNEHCVLNYYVTQLVTGHASFKKYLHRFCHDTSPIYPNCVDEEEDTEHILTCPDLDGPGDEFRANPSNGRAVEL